MGQGLLRLFLQAFLLATINQKFQPTRIGWSSRYPPFMIGFRTTSRTASNLKEGEYEALHGFIRTT